MVGITGAIIGSAVIGAGASIISGNKAAKASKKASDQVVAENRRQYEQDRADFAPWRNIGAGAITQLGQAYGLGDSAGTGYIQRDSMSANGAEVAPTVGGYGGFFTSPGYKFRVDEAQKAVERAASAGGRLASGATLTRAGEVQQGIASDEYGNWWNRLAGLAGVGQAATASTSQAGQIATGNISNSITNAGNARASAFLNTGSSINQGINNVLQAYLFNKGGGFGK